MPKQTFLNLPEEKRNRILECAIDEFSKHPYEKASISRVVKEAGIAKGSFYQYFEDKLDLYAYLLKLMGDLKLEYLNKLEIKIEGVDFFDYLRSLYYGGLMFAKSHPRISKIGVFLMKSESKELREKIIEENYQLAQEYFKGLINRGIQSGSVREDIDIDFLIHMMIHMQMLVGEYYFKAFDADDYDDENHELMRLLDQMIDLIRRGIEAP